MPVKTKIKTHILLIRTGAVGPDLPLCSSTAQHKMEILPLAEWEKVDPAFQCGNCKSAIARERKRNADLPK